LVSQSIVVMTEARGQFMNPEERELPSLETVTRRLVNTVAEDTSVCGSVY
jgi:hypothetical protein